MADAISTYGVRVEADTAGADKFVAATQAMAQSAQGADRAIAAAASRQGVSYAEQAAKVSAATGDIVGNMQKMVQTHVQATNSFGNVATGARRVSEEMRALAGAKIGRASW